MATITATKFSFIKKHSNSNSDSTSTSKSKSKSTLTLTSKSKSTSHPDTNAKILSPTDRDVLCGRGKGIRFHPGNVLFNKLLKQHYPDYGMTPKGSKLEIVKKIMATIQEGQAGGTGRFLEQDNGGFYREIGEERAINKTAQAFRDIRVTKEKKQQQLKHSQKRQQQRQQQQQQHQKHLTRKMLIDRDCHNSVSSGDDSAASRRPTFRQRIAMLHRHNASASAESDRENSVSEAGDDASVSDTETEDSFPMYHPPCRHKHDGLLVS
mmetsp:Transcript_21558/g.51072  ORF Transcript_21558/g.51072 Transcript_21558/m.51072 type:complete len:266 (+) Transcript_21558:289-1086(+)|eukprot:CAMPEP_0172386208 /NCGR_PEP_ID=MMETSP1061-20121228/3792_1 /TAXON_ID=37318 /ORGANISM="Pseudo-nitzschia pungens, Strain cf. pungens" /LENGTH=265 /DNA_ID=CAMNT_0013115527 /DNA_START=280 /DNA_END=1077 /DNA_ORIENTATION=-